MENLFSNQPLLIPIVIIHKDEPEALDAMLTSIRENTNYPHQIFIVDNASKLAEARDYLRKLSSHQEYNLILNKSNNWVLGFNLVFKHSRWPKGCSLMVFSDCDIVVPALSENELCWLSYLKQQMDTYVCIGKLGLSLMVDDLDESELNQKIIKREARFDKNPTIGTNTICGVDTTLAIYRNDFFMMENFKFLIGHASVAKPHYYTCRVSRKYQAKHLGWYKKLDALSMRYLQEKILCFAKYAAYIEPEVLSAASWRYRCYFKIVSSLAKFFWSARILMIVFLYYLKCFPRAMNPLQNAAKYEQ